MHATDVDLLGEPNEVVLSAAATERRTLVTANTDLRMLLALSRAPAPSVLLLRRGGRSFDVGSWTHNVFHGLHRG